MITSKVRNEDVSPLRELIARVLYYVADRVMLVPKDAHTVRISMFQNGMRLRTTMIGRKTAIAKFRYFFQETPGTTCPVPESSSNEE